LGEHRISWIVHSGGAGNTPSIFGNVYIVMILKYGILSAIQQFWSDTSNFQLQRSDLDV